MSCLALCQWCAPLFRGNSYWCYMMRVSGLPSEKCVLTISIQTEAICEK